MTIPSEYKKFGFDFEANPVMKCFINEKGELVIQPPEEDPIEKLCGILKGVKIDPEFEGLTLKEQIQLAKKKKYEEKYKNNRL